MTAGADGSDEIASALAEILHEAEMVAASEALPPGYVDELEERFEALAADVAALERAVDAGALERPQQYRDGATSGAGPVPGPGSPLAARARALTHGTAARARRLAGPRIRALQRRALDGAGSASEAAATLGLVATDRLRRLASSGSGSDRLERLSPGARTLPTAGRRTSRSGSGLVGAREPGSAAAPLVDWTLEQVARAAPGRVIHVECADGELVRLLEVAGHDAVGADRAFGADRALGADRSARSSKSVARAGALEFLGRQRRGSLGAVVLSGVTDRVSPASARALAQLSASRLQPGGTVVIVSAHPLSPASGDPITSDLDVRRPLHPVTWCHLLARFGFGEIAVFDPSAAPDPDGTLYGVAARRR